MKKYTKQEITEILEIHRKWLNNEDGGKRADLSFSDLRSANLRYSDLSSADLSFSDLRSANLRYSDLSSADLRSADLRSANLRYSDLSSADLRSADLSSADLRSADLSSADLSSADLRSANLSFSDLRYSDLSSADLSSANLNSANLDKRYVQISCVGSSKRMTTYCFDDDIIWCGCFKGTLNDFEIQVKETHKNNIQHLKEYMGFIDYIKSLK